MPKCTQKSLRERLHPSWMNRPLLMPHIPPEGVLSHKGLLGMCRWMGSHFRDWIDFNGVTFLVELLEWDRTFSGFLG